MILTGLLNSRVLKVAIVAILWGLLFTLNHWLFARIEVNAFVSWIFLPAALRMVSVMLLNWDAAMGLILGALVTAEATQAGDFLTMFPLACISGLAPMLAIAIGTALMGIGHNLSHLKPRHLWAYAALGAFFNASLSQLYLQTVLPNPDPWGIVLKMFMGDLIGSALTLCLMAAILSRLPASPSPRA